MALFSRRGKGDEPAGGEPDATEPASSEASDPTGGGESPAPADEVVPEVGISISTFGKPAASARPAPEPPAATQAVPGLPDNVIVKNALAALPEKPRNTDVMNVMRQALQGHLYVRVQGDAKALLAEGQNLTLAVTAIEDKRFLLAFTGGTALQDSVRADGDTATSAIGQPTATIFQNVVAGPYAGLFLDHATSGARIILPSELIGKALEEGDPAFTLKTLLVSERAADTTAKVVDALTRVPVWVAGNADESGRIGLAEARSTDGRRRLEIFSHPLEVIALGRGDRPLPLTGEQLGKALASDAGITGVVVDPAGPWIELDRADLAPVIALA
jgi:hypothetical protein